MDEWANFNVLQVMKVRLSLEQAKVECLLGCTVSSSRRKNRRKLKSLHGERAASVQNREEREHRQNKHNAQNRNMSVNRYGDVEADDKSFDTIQLPTFGDWKEVKLMGKQSRESGGNQMKKQASFRTLGSSKKQRTTSRVKLYENNRIKQIAETVKMRPKPLYPIQNIMVRRFVPDDEPEPKKKPIQRTLVTRSRAMSRQLHPNFESLVCTSQKVLSRNSTFKSLYMRQKQKYQQILRKYNIDQDIDDSEFETYFKK